MDRKFKSPVATYDDLKIDSGEFTKTIKVNGKDVLVSVLLVHPGQGDPASVTFAGQMKAALIKAFGDRQVIVFEGHAGPLYGFALANWNVTEAGGADDSEPPGLSIPRTSTRWCWPAVVTRTWSPIRSTKTPSSRAG